MLNVCALKSKLKIYIRLSYLAYKLTGKTSVASDHGFAFHQFLWAFILYTYFVRQTESKHFNFGEIQ